MKIFKFYVESKIGAVKGKDGVMYDTISFEAADQQAAEKKIQNIIRKEGFDASKVKSNIK